MKKISALLLIIFFSISCASAIRYTVEEIKPFPPPIQDKIKKGEIATGMTIIQVRYAWGAPDIVDVLPPDKEGFDRVKWTYKRLDRKSTRLNSSHTDISRMPSSA